MKFKKIYVEITNICNKNCSFCSTSKRKKNEMSPTLFTKIIKQVKVYTDYIYLHIKGEPLLHSQFKEVIAICEKHKIKVNITTNGTLLEKQKDTLISPTIRQINISMQAYETNIDKNEISHIIDTVNYILENNKNINIVYRFWALENNQFSHSNKIILELLKEKYNLVHNDIDALLALNNIKVKDRLYINICPSFDWPSLENDINSSIGTCYGIKHHIGILSDGTVIPCCLDSDGIINLGNIFEKSLDDIIASPKFVKLHKDIVNHKFNEDLCKHCSYKEQLYFKKVK